MKLVNNAKSILKTNIVNDSNSFLIQDGEGDLFKYEIDGENNNDFIVWAEEIENDIVIKREPIKVKRDGDVFTILERKCQMCVGNDSSITKTREQKKYNFTAGITQISIYMSENDIDEINSNTDYIDNIKENGILETETDLEIKNSDGELQKINSKEILIEGNAINTAGGVVKIGTNGFINNDLIDTANLTGATLVAQSNILEGDKIGFHTTELLERTSLGKKVLVKTVPNGNAEYIGFAKADYNIGDIVEIQNYDDYYTNIETSIEADKNALTSEGNLVITNGQTVNIDISQKHLFNSIDIQAGGILKPTGTGDLAWIYCSGDCNIDGEIDFSDFQPHKDSIIASFNGYIGVDTQCGIGGYGGRGGAGKYNSTYKNGGFPNGSTPSSGIGNGGGGGGGGGAQGNGSTGGTRGYPGGTTSGGTSCGGQGGYGGGYGCNGGLAYGGHGESDYSSGGRGGGGGGGGSVGKSGIHILLYVNGNLTGTGVIKTNGGIGGNGGTGGRGEASNTNYWGGTGGGGGGGGGGAGGNIYSNKDIGNITTIETGGNGGTGGGGISGYQGLGNNWSAGRVGIAGDSGDFINITIDNGILSDTYNG